VSFKKCDLEQARFVNCLTVKHAGDLVFSSKVDASVGSFTTRSLSCFSPPAPSTSAIATA
jgi:hypothetical protein